MIRIVLRWRLMMGSLRGHESFTDDLREDEEEPSLGGMTTTTRSTGRFAKFSRLLRRSFRPHADI